MGNVLLNSICLLNLKYQKIKLQLSKTCQNSTHSGLKKVQHTHLSTDVDWYIACAVSVRGGGSSHQVCVPYCNLHPFPCQNCFCCSLFPFFCPLCPCPFSSTFSICTWQLKAPRTNSRCRLLQEPMRTLKIATNICIKLWILNNIK